jgi:NAD(P)-dependent dehydrogenase (short-subunit alcohol dehydrogenase family)
MVDVAVASVAYLIGHLDRRLGLGARIRELAGAEQRTEPHHRPDADIRRYPVLLGGPQPGVDERGRLVEAAAVGQVENDYGRLDVLVNNAGTAEPRVGAADLTAQEAMKGFGINVFGPIRVTHAFLPLLRASAHPRIVNVSSGVGSFARLLTPGTVENAVTLPVYPATKAALTMLTVQYARALDGILVNAADPGFTATDFNHHRGTQTVAEGADAIVRLATLPKDGPTGTFQDRHGTVPW